jgi:hypothetical protein
MFRPAPLVVMLVRGLLVCPVWLAFFIRYRGCLTHSRHFLFDPYTPSIPSRCSRAKGVHRMVNRLGDRRVGRQVAGSSENEPSILSLWLLTIICAFLL